MDENEKLIKNIISEQLNIDINKISNKSFLIADLGMDSFGAVELGFTLQNKLAVGFTQEDMIKMKTVEDIISFIKNAKK